MPSSAKRSTPAASTTASRSATHWSSVNGIAGDVAIGQAAAALVVVDEGVVEALEPVHDPGSAGSCSRCVIQFRGLDDRRAAPWTPNASRTPSAAGAERKPGASASARAYGAGERRARPFGGAIPATTTSRPSPHCRPRAGRRSARARAPRVAAARRSRSRRCRPPGRRSRTRAGDLRAGPRRRRLSPSRASGGVRREPDARDAFEPVGLERCRAQRLADEPRRRHAFAGRRIRGLSVDATLSPWLDAFSSSARRARSARRRSTSSRVRGELELVGLCAERSWGALVAQARAHGVARIALADADAGARAGEAWTDGEVLHRRRGARAAGDRLRGRPRAQRAGRLGGPRADGRDAGRGHRPRAGQQGVARRRRRARDAARRGDRSADPARRLRALGAAPAAGRGAARGPSSKLVLTASRRPLPRAQRAELARRLASRRRSPSDVGDGRQDHDRLGDADEQGPRDDRGPPPVRRAVRARSTSSSTRSRSSTHRDAVRRRRARPPRLPGHARADLLRAAPPRARRRPGAGRLDLARVGALELRARRRRRVPVPAAGARGGGEAGGTAPCVLNAANEVAVHAFLAAASASSGSPR